TASRPMIKPLMRPRTTVPVSIGIVYSTLGVAKPPAAIPIRQKSIAPSRREQENATIATNYRPSGRNAPSRAEGGPHEIATADDHGRGGAGRIDGDWGRGVQRLGVGLEPAQPGCRPPRLPLRAERPSGAAAARPGPQGRSGQRRGEEGLQLRPRAARV